VRRAFKQRTRKPGKHKLLLKAVASGARLRDSKACADTACPHKARADHFTALAELHKVTVEALKRQIGDQDETIAQAGDKLRRALEAKDRAHDAEGVKYLASLNDAHDHFELAVRDAKQRHAIAAERTALVVKEISDRAERYKAERDALRAVLSKHRATQDAAKDKERQNRQRSLFPGTVPASKRASARTPCPRRTTRYRRRYPARSCST
jgi:hypothetical protein